MKGIVTRQYFSYLILIVFFFFSIATLRQSDRRLAFLFNLIRIINISLNSLAL